MNGPTRAGPVPSALAFLKETGDIASAVVTSSQGAKSSGATAWQAFFKDELPRWMSERLLETTFDFSAGDKVLDERLGARSVSFAAASATNLPPVAREAFVAAFTAAAEKNGLTVASLAFTDTGVTFNLDAPSLRIKHPFTKALEAVLNGQKAPSAFFLPDAFETFMTSLTTATVEKLEGAKRAAIDNAAEEFRRTGSTEPGDIVAVLPLDATIDGDPATVATALCAAAQLRAELVDAGYDVTKFVHSGHNPTRFVDATVVSRVRTKPEER